MSATIQLAVHCAWCGRVVRRGKALPPHPDDRGDGAPPVSHGICKNCFSRERLVIRQIFHPLPRGPST